MYLKRIEAQGFKSFANRAVFEFTPGIMGIVGPNGSGKSNVADAVRWVLGEQSAKQLRGSNMQDVIFAGTENRRAMGYAYVAVTLDNSDHSLRADYDEVTVTRQVFRSGESEYRINGNICRLKDIYELFYDTGIGREGYSIIGQGQIDQILSNKPEERREMFDEAAGIVKYKKRKEITVKKLDEEHQNLLRVTDIVNELESRIGPLEKQAENAKHYLNLHDSLKAYEIGAFYLESSDLENKLGSVRTNLELISQDLLQAHGEADELKARYDTLTAELEALEAELEASRTRIGDIRVDRENAEGRIALLKEQIRAARQNEEHFAQRMQSVEERLQKLSLEKNGFLEQKTELNRLLDQTDDKISRMEEKIAEADEAVRRFKEASDDRSSAILKSMDDKAAINGELQGLETRCSELVLRRSGLNQQLLSAKAEEEDRENDLAAMAQAIAGLKKLLDDDGRMETELQAKLADRKKLLAELNASCAEKEKNVHMIGSRLEALRNLTERYEGYGSSVRKVMDRKTDFPGIRGVVADLITAERTYETAIETALGGKIQNIVTETEADAKEMIRYLKENAIGRATFLPMDSVDRTEDFPAPDALKEKGSLGRASELVHYDSEYAGIVRSLLGNILVARDMNVGSAIARKYHFRLHIVTLEGEYFSPGGAISGGAFRNNSNLLGRRRELSELNAQLEKAKKELAAASEKRTLVAGEADASAESLESLHSILENTRLKEATLSLQLKQGRKELEQLKNSHKDCVSEVKELGLQLQELEKQKKEVQKQIQALEKDNELRRREISGITVKIEKEKARRSEKFRELDALRAEFAGQNQKNEFLLENIRRVNGEEESTLQEQKQLVLSREESGSLIREREEEIEALKLAVTEGEKEYSLLTEQLASGQKVREDKKVKQQGFFDAREILSKRITDLDKESFRLQNQQQHLEEQIERQAEYLWSEYEMTPSQAIKAYDPEITDLNEARKFISQKKSEIRELGPINISAIDEYAELSERYTFLKTQQDDIVKAESELQNIIDQLDEGMRKQFSDQFSVIQKEFDNVFRDLFGGGKGTLELQPGEDVLDAGIIINAQPPGKRLQNMMQLSGGEKALTAIALLFAIQRLKPSPFCLLDEIEAALDEPNVVRFADYLEKLKKTTQFLVITHRRGTMEMADRLYGVTMQEKGISVLVSVMLTDPASKTILDEM